MISRWTSRRDFWHVVVILILLNQTIFKPTKIAAEEQPTNVTANRPACPSKEFTRFFDTFSESAEIQKTFTQLPLIYGLRLEYPPKLSKRKIASFEEIPSYDPEHFGAIFPTQAVRDEFGNFISMVIDADDHRVAAWRRYTAGANIKVGAGVNSVSAVLGVEGTGVSVRYRFHRLKNCWYLYEIDDNST